MSILVWNSWVLGQPATVQELVRLILTHKPCLVFICETRLSKERVRNLRFRLGMENFFMSRVLVMVAALICTLRKVSQWIFSLLAQGILMCMSAVALSLNYGEAPLSMVNLEPVIVISCGTSCA